MFKFWGVKRIGWVNRTGGQGRDGVKRRGGGSRREGGTKVGSTAHLIMNIQPLFKLTHMHYAVQTHSLVIGRG